jgi:hypothetical protein
MERIFGLVFSGFTVRAFGVCLALYVGITAANFASDAFNKAAAGFEQVKAAR